MSSLPRPGETFTKPIYWYWSIKNECVSLSPWKMFDTEGYIYFGEALTTFTIPATCNPLNEALASLAAAETKARGELEAKLAAIQGMRNNLLAIELAPPAPSTNVTHDVFHGDVAFPF